MENEKEYQKEYRETHREEFKKYQKTYYKKNKKLVNERNKKRYLENKDTIRWRHKINHIKIKYGLTEKQYVSLLQKANNKCEICGSKKILCVDHCHNTGKVRGILCRECNLTLSYVENKDISKFMQYLDKVMK